MDEVRYALVRPPTPLPGNGPAPWPTPLGEAAYHGIAGDVVRTLEPHTEADPAGLLVTLLAAAGNIIGTGPHYLVSGARHPGRIFPVLVGATNSGRKGTTLSTLAPVFELACPAWWRRREKGLSSGEGLIWRVRDRDDTGGEEAGDAPLFVVETEFGEVLQVLAREGNTLSTVLRDAWDGGPLSSMTKTSPARASDPHITLLGHVTPEELRALLSDREASNGFANRFLWVCVARSKLLPHGGDPEDGALLWLGTLLERTLADARGLGRLRFDADARAAWERVYEPLTGDEAGLVGRLLGRAAPTVLRLAVIYAALDVAPAIGRPHLAAALEVWAYADASVRHIFGALIPGAEDPLAPTILAALEGGDVTQSELHALFGNNMQAPRLLTSLEVLARAGRIAREIAGPASGRGRSIVRWRLVRDGE